MQEPESSRSKQAILDYWTLVEFFSPYILDNALHTNQDIQKLYAGDSARELLPWLNAPIIAEGNPADPFAKGYQLFLGLFNIEETADKARHVFAHQASLWESVTWRNCGAASSTTCFARLTVTTHGTPLLGTLSLSTLPWAHGRLLNGNMTSLHMEEYWKSVNRLLAMLKEEFSSKLPKRVVKEPKTEARYLDVNAIPQLMSFLYQWAGYHPKGYPLVLIQEVSDDLTVAAKDPQLKSERDVGILNSFYLQDLEAASASLPNQRGKPIDHYLSECHEQRILLESEEGTKAILETLRPNKIPLGRWPAPPSHQQSLMQQFTINAAYDPCRRKDVFSVNGPPGTGKTSLLREIIAQNIVARAQSLSQFTKATEVFIGRQALNFEGTEPIFTSELDPSLLGYEMVVVSSNNTAVENLTQALPLRSQLDPASYAASYLETVTNKVVGSKEGEAWGLVSATLGNKENCRDFVESVFIKGSETYGHARIWEWIEAYEGPSFSMARDAFIASMHEVEKLLEELENLAFLHDALQDQTLDTFCATELDALHEVESESEQIQAKLSQLLHEEKEAQELLALYQERETLWKLERPHAIARIMDRKAAEAWSAILKGYRKERLEKIEELQTCKKRLTETRQLLTQQEARESQTAENFIDRAILFHLYQNAYENLITRHSGVRLPKGWGELEEDDNQTQSYYQSEELNAKRSRLFVAAMTLHEAWLAETSQIKGGFRGNLMAISALLQGKNPSTADDTRRAWQSVFMLVPVISSTFASVGRLFRYLEPGSLGWVLIDEAGQALPQAAVGAIWRAKRIISIGDPFQIEPICTIPPEVVDGMAKKRINDDLLSWAPSRVSVQNLMDRASVFGSKRTINEECQWLGSPLRVHRRCLEPMFTIANTIAYEGSMLLKTAPCKELSLPPSCWWDIRGRASHKQFVPDQADVLVELLMHSLPKMNSPDIYIISPFREVITQIQKTILEHQVIKEIFKQKFPAITFHAWVREAIGTVHTFQGKQAAVVYFVLGADKSTEGAIAWASQKPNLLNVAVTRAQSRFYMIGDYQLWKTRPHFDVAAKLLKRQPYARAV